MLACLPPTIFSPQRSVGIRILTAGLCPTAALIMGEISPIKPPATRMPVTPRITSASLHCQAMAFSPGCPLFCAGFQHRRGRQRVGAKGGQRDFGQRFVELGDKRFADAAALAVNNQNFQFVYLSIGNRLFFQQRSARF